MKGVWRKIGARLAQEKKNWAQVSFILSPVHCRKGRLSVFPTDTGKSGASLAQDWRKIPRKIRFSGCGGAQEICLTEPNSQCPVLMRKRAPKKLSTSVLTETRSPVLRRKEVVVQYGKHVPSTKTEKNKPQTRRARLAQVWRKKNILAQVLL